MSSITLASLLRVRELSPGGDRGDLEFWMVLAHSGIAPPAHIFSCFLRSRDFRAYVAPVARLYLALFRRPPDRGGLDYWTQRRRRGVSLEAVAEAFSASPEFAGLGALSNREVVVRAHRSTLGEPTAAVVDYWAGRLDSGIIKRGEMLCAFSEHPDFVRRAGDEVLVAMLYILWLRRGPDPQGFDFFLALLRRDGAEAAVTKMLDSREYRRAFEARPSEERDA